MSLPLAHTVCCGRGQHGQKEQKVNKTIILLMFCIKMCGSGCYGFAVAAALLCVGRAVRQLKKAGLEP